MGSLLRVIMGKCGTMIIDGGQTTPPFSPGARGLVLDDLKLCGVTLTWTSIAPEVVAADEAGDRWDILCRKSPQRSIPGISDAI